MRHVFASLLQFLSKLLSNVNLAITDFSSTIQIHEYMLSKAPPVPQLNSSQAPEEPNTEREIEEQTNLPNGDAIAAAAAAAADELQDPRMADRIVEEERPEAPLNANPSPASRPAASAELLLQKPGARAQRIPEDRLLAWAAIGLTIAIMVLLLKKFLKSSGHDAVFMDGS